MQKTYHVSLDIVDDTVEFVKESGDKSDDIDNIPTDSMLEYIQKAIHRLSQNAIVWSICNECESHDVGVWSKGMSGET